MIPIDKVRRLEVFDGNGAWVAASPAQVEEGDVIRFIEPSGEYAHGGKAYRVEKTPGIIVAEWPPTSIGMAASTPPAP